MKIIAKSIIALLMSGILTGGLHSCTSHFEDYNKDPHEATDEDMDNDFYKIRAVMLGLQNWVVPMDVNQFQFISCLLGGSFGGYLSDSGSWAQKISTYDPTPNWTSPAFNQIITNIYQDYNKLQSYTDSPVPLAVATVIKVAAMHQVTDIYGPIPYSKIGEGKSNAPYDSQKDVYGHMFRELDEAIETLTKFQGEMLSPKMDNIFNGSIIKWAKFANSLKLRLAMRIVYADPDLAREKAEQVIAHEIGPMSDNTDSAFKPVTVQNPFRVIMYEYNGGDSRISADITSYMNGYGDPRRDKYFTKSTFAFEEWTGMQNGYYGLRSGIRNSAEGKQYSNMVVQQGDPLMWMNAAETAFLRAEGALRGWNMGGSAQEFYNSGITLSFGQWGISGASDYMNNDYSTPDAYDDPWLYYSSYTPRSTIPIAWLNSGDFEKNLEQIITQKWIANFPLGLEAWAEFRRTGYPKLLPVPHNMSGGIVDSEKMARRLPFPQEEFTNNRENYLKALVMLGGQDNMATNVWWDCK